MTFPLQPNDELVGVSWLGSIAGLSTQMVATTLPSDDTTWTQTGFITVSVVGGTPNAYLPEESPVMQVDCWATVPGSNKPPWFKANALARVIRRATLDRYNIPRVLTITANGITYPKAVVKTAYLATSFRRIYDDAGDYARYSGDVALTWVTVGEVIP